VARYIPTGVNAGNGGELTAQSLFDSLSVPAVRPTVIPSIINDGGVDKLLLQSETYINNLLIVSEYGDDSTAEVGNSNKHFASIEAALTMAPSNSIVWVFGDHRIEDNIIIDNGRLISIFILGGLIRSNNSLSNELFILNNNSRLYFTGTRRARFLFGGFPNHVFRLSNSSFVSIRDFNTIASQYLITATNSFAEFERNSSIIAQGTASGSSAFHINGGILKIDNHSLITNLTPYMINAFNDAVIKLRRIDNLNCNEILLISNSNDSGCSFSMYDVYLSNSSAASNSLGAIYTTNESDIFIKNSELVSSVCKVIDMVGSLRVKRTSLKTTGSIEAIQYTQSNASENYILDSKIVGGATNLNFTGNSGNSAQLLIDGVRTNNWPDFTSEPQIIEGNVLVNTNIN